ncbi:acyl-CoA thioesterase [uncultured Cohaesibacter sp.]|uniref:acyl-CoA thioesterase n=1 Tax=uncultured Cohaesibacter sp. TaxID=1002546 RepID=UPI0029C7F3C4|nr:acyl-CoA thioesterase [uncultured Cohaesibacter sp.]
MYPVVRLTSTILKARRQVKKAPLPFEGTSEISFICRPWDLDMFLEMNNGRVLTLYDLGRFDYAIRTGFTDAMKRQKWGLAVAGSTTRYRRRVRLFDKVTMRTKVAAVEDRWFYMSQSMWVRGEPVSAALLRTCVTKKGRSLLASEVIAAIPGADAAAITPDWVSAWAEADQMRPWPPEEQ